jgi:cytochrome c553
VIVRAVLKWTGIVLGTMLGLVVVALGVLYVASNLRLHKHYVVHVAPLAIPHDSAAIARGSHLAHAVSGCVDCHGPDLAGTTMIDQRPFAVVSAPNITPAGLGSQLSDGDLVRAIRYGVAPDGRSLAVMPSAVYYHLSDADLAAIIAYVRSVPPATRPLKPTSYGPISRLLLVTGKAPILQAELIDTSAARPAPAPGVTPEYGAYLASVGGCQECHGPGLSGGPIPGGDPHAPPAANLTRGGIGRWTEADFRRALREGKRPDGTTISSFMPYRVVGNMTDDEIAALWMYLQSLPPRPYGNR